tara:strand:- start:19 stop:459 length:441 start_codon:yes stop_codon:yes gene_type:complete
MNLHEAINLIHALATLYMVGLIWFVQLVHYPLFALISEADYKKYQSEHVTRTGWVVGAPMLAEALSALWLAIQPSSFVDGIIPWIGLLLVLIIWLATAIFSIPVHNLLSSGFDEKAHARLVQTNWIRTIAWSLRAPLALYLLTISS